MTRQLRLLRMHGLLRKVDDERQALVAGGTNPAYSQALETIASADSKDDLAAAYARLVPVALEHTH